MQVISITELHTSWKFQFVENPLIAKGDIIVPAPVSCVGTYWEEIQKPQVILEWQHETENAFSIKLQVEATLLLALPQKLRIHTNDFMSSPRYQWTTHSP